MTAPKETVVNQGFAGLLYEDGAFVKVLAPGKHKLKHGWFDSKKRMVVIVDVRERSITIKGQEILTADKVAIRVSLLVYFRVTNPEAAVHNVASYEERIYEDVQLAARRFLARRTLEAILSDRNEISDAVRDDVKNTASTYGVEIIRADVKDLVFPGNLREIMNQVLETERKAEAKLIQARKDAEAQKIKNDADNQAARERLDAERERLHITAESERERLRIAAEGELERARLQRQAAVDEARALAEHPQLQRLRELQTLTEMARGGGRFVVGLRGEALGDLLHDTKAAAPR
jgi:regulator of protease activity HflC (stomatin/prohibitin superfamily)